MDQICRAFGWARRAQLIKPKGYSPPQDLEKAREAVYFSSIYIYTNKQSCFRISLGKRFNFNHTFFFNSLISKETNFISFSSVYFRFDNWDKSMAANWACAIFWNIIIRSRKQSLLHCARW